MKSVKHGSWLPDMDLNHDKQIQSLLCYRYTIGQAGAGCKLDALALQSRLLPRTEADLTAETRSRGVSTATACKSPRLRYSAVNHVASD